MNRHAVLPGQCITGSNLNRQSSAVQAAFERYQFQNDTVVIDAVPAVKAQPVVKHRVIKSDPRSEVVSVRVPFAVIERRDERIEICDTCSVFHARIDLVSEPDIECQVSPHTPVVLRKKCKIVVVDVR